MLEGIDGRSAIARRLRDILKGLLVEFEIETPADDILIRQAAITVRHQRAAADQDRERRASDIKTLTNLSVSCAEFWRTCASATARRGPPPPSLHEHLAVLRHAAGRR